MKNMNARAICEGAIVSALTVVLLLLGMYVPLFGLLSMFICGLPLVYLMIRQSLKISIISFVASILVISILTGNFITGALSACVSLLPALAIGYCMSKNYNYYTTLASGIVGVIIGILINILIYTMLINQGNTVVGMVDDTIATMRGILNSYLDTARQSTADSAAIAEMSGLIDNLLSQTRNIILSYFPALLVVLSSVLGYLITSVCFFFMRRIKVRAGNYITFSLLSAPRSMCVVTVILTIVTFFLKDNSLSTLALKNVAVVLSFVLVVNGLAFTDFRLSAKVEKGYLRFLIYLGIFILGYVFVSTIYYILLLVGMVDANLDLRMLRNTGDNDEN